MAAATDRRTSGVDIHISGLHAAYGDTPVLNGIDLSIGAGEFIALLGASGSGKTTLLRCLSGFVMPTGGSITLGETDVTGLPPERRGMAMVFQSYALWPHMTVRQNIGYGLRLRRWRRGDIAARVDQLTEMLGLQGLSERKTTQLSGGQKQRVALGRALAIDPPVLLLDEPLSNLDARIRVAMRHEIRMLQRRLGITAVHVTHDREEAMVMADRIVILNQGQIAQAGAPAEVYEYPSSAFVAGFMGADNEIELRAAAEETRVAVEVPGGTCFLPRSRREGDGGLRWHADRDGTVSVRFRPDEGRIAADGGVPEGHLGLPGIIRQAAYPGGVRRYTVECQGRLLTIDDPAVHGEGAQVTVALPPSSLHVFAADRQAVGNGG